MDTNRNTQQRESGLFVLRHESHLTVGLSIPNDAAFATFHRLPVRQRSSLRPKIAIQYKVHLFRFHDTHHQPRILFPTKLCLAVRGRFQTIAHASVHTVDNQ